MKLLLSFLLLYACVPASWAAQTRIALHNPVPCGYVSDLVIRDLDGDGLTDLMEYQTASPDLTSVYFYRGPALSNLWRAQPKMLPPSSRLLESCPVPAQGETGALDTAGRTPDGLVRITFDSIDSRRLRKDMFGGADRLLGRVLAARALTDDIRLEFRNWIQVRLETDIVPDRRIRCVTSCDCLAIRPFFFR